LQFWIVIHPKEILKPTNTARLIQATIPHTRCFLWQRTTPPPALVALLNNPQFAPYVVCPAGDPVRLEHVAQDPCHAGRVPAFIILDGTWSQVKKMWYRSPYLHRLPCLAIQPEAPSAYTLRRQLRAGYLSTVEVAIALLARLDSPVMSHILGTYFRVFIASSLAARHGHPSPRTLPEVPQLLAYRRRQTPG
jgi:hypothetical protein